MTVPKAVRDALGLQSGDRVVFRVEGNRPVLARTPDFLATEPLAVVCDFADACVLVVKVLAPGLVLSSASPMRTPLQEAE